MFLFASFYSDFTGTFFQQEFLLEIYPRSWNTWAPRADALRTISLSLLTGLSWRGITFLISLKAIPGTII